MCPLPVARVHGAGARPIAALVVLMAIGFGVLSARTGQAITDAELARIDAHRAWTQTAVLRIELETVRAAMPKPLAVDEVCRKRTVALRGALMALVRTGSVSMVGDPGPEWIEWRMEDAR